MLPGVTRPRHPLLAILVTLAAAIPVHADVTGSILGIVTDSSGGVLGGAHVVATNLETGLSRIASSDPTGQYRLLALPVGHYKVEATHAGFQTFLSTGVELTVNEERRVDIVLQVGNVAQSVEVQAAPVQVETTSTQLGDVIGEQKLLSLPLNGRSYIDLLGLQAGVIPVTAASIQQDRPVSGNLSAGNLSVNGQRETANAFLVNGGDVSEGRNLGASVIPNLDSVAEFRLITNSFEAEYGKFSGAIMNAITKSGSNGLHGAAFEFLRNDQLDARNFFDPERGAFKRNQFGYAVGGPFLKNKLFWFTDYQGTREVRGLSTGFVQVPTVAERGGNFAGLNAFVDSSGNPTTVNGPYWAQVLTQRLGYGVQSGEPYSPAGCTLTANCVFPGGVIPQQAFSKPAVGILPYIPMPSTGANLYATSSQNQRTVDDKAGQRVDLLNQLTGSWFFYYFFDQANVTSPFGGNNIPGFATGTPRRAQQAVLSNTHVFGPTAVNEARVNYTRDAITTDQVLSGFAKLSDLGFVTGPGTLGIVPNLPNFQFVPGLTFNAFNTGVNTQLRKQANNTWQAADNFSKIYGPHTLKFGGEFRYYQINDRNLCAPNGLFSFNGSETGTDFADYLLGAPAGYTQCSFQIMDSRSRYGGAFAEDSFRMKPNITLNYGVRWEVNMPWYDKYNRSETIVPGQQSIEFPTAPKGWVVPGDPGIPQTLAPTRYNNFAPRLGLAYSPAFNDGALGKIFGGPGKTSIRVAYGIFYTSIEDLELFYEEGDAPYGLYWPSIQPPLFEEPFLDRSDGRSQVQRFPFVLPVPGAPSNKTLDYSVYLPIQGSPGYDIHNRVPYAEHYNLTIQRALSSSTIMTLAYVGTQGHRLIAETESNPGNPRLCLSLRGTGVKAGTAECGPYGELGVYTRPDGTIVDGTRGPLGPAFGSDAYTGNIASSSYNSFQASLERKAADFTFLAAYSFSKSMDDSSGYTEWINFTNYRLSRSLSQYDMTHNFVISYNYLIPFSKAFSALPRRLTEGWSVNGITRFSTGLPITISQGSDLSLTGSGSTDVPNFIGPLVTQDPRNSGPGGLPNQYFSPDAFASGPLGAFGNSNRRFFHGPGINNWDFALHKTTQLRESMSLQFRAEFFNIANHAQFLNPTGNFTSSQFGEVTSARDPRIGQLSLKFLW
jgi:hypothetical protein